MHCFLLQANNVRRARNPGKVYVGWALVLLLLNIAIPRAIGSMSEIGYNALGDALGETCQMVLESWFPRWKLV